MKTWFVGDLHLGYQYLIEKGVREPGWEREVLTMWNDCVTQKDTVYVLGDVAFARQAYWFSRLSKLPGNKILMLGNHDKNKINWYKKWGWAEVHEFNKYVLLRHDYGNIMITHIPVFPAVLTAYDDRFTGLCYKFNRVFDRSSSVLNIHSHTHGVAKEQHNTIDVSLEATRNQLVTLEQIIQIKFKE